MPDSKRRVFTCIAIFSLGACYSQLAAADDGHESAEPISGTAVPAIPVYVDPQVVETIMQASELRSYFSERQAEARAHRDANLQQINADTQHAREELALQIRQARDEAQAAYVDGLDALSQSDLSMDERNRRRQELADTKDAALLAISERHQNRSEEIASQRELRRSVELTRSADFIASLNSQLTSRLEVVQSAGSDVTGTPLPDDLAAGPSQGLPPQAELTPVARPDNSQPEPELQTERPDSGPIFVAVVITTEPLSAIGSDELSARAQRIAAAGDFRPVVINTNPLGAVGSDELSARGRAIAAAGEFSPITLTTPMLEAVGVEE